MNTKSKNVVLVMSGKNNITFSRGNVLIKTLLKLIATEMLLSNLLAVF